MAREFDADGALAEPELRNPLALLRGALRPAPAAAPAGAGETGGGATEATEARRKKPERPARVQLVYPRHFSAAARGGMHDDPVRQLCEESPSKWALAVEGVFKGMSYTRPDEHAVRGAPCVALLARALGHGLQVRGGQDRLGFLFLYEVTN